MNEEILIKEEFRFTASYCHQLNMSQCEVMDKKGDGFVINIYNLSDNTSTNT